MNLEPSNRSGVSLVEVMVSILLLLIAFLGWMRMNSIQAVRKESIRYAAVEKAAGLLDACDSASPHVGKRVVGGFYYWKDGKLTRMKSSTETVPLWEKGEWSGEDVPVVGYRIAIENLPAMAEESSLYWNGGLWARLELFDDYRKGAAERPFADLRAYVKGGND